MRGVVMGRNPAQRSHRAKPWNVFAILFLSATMARMLEGAFVGSLSCDRTISILVGEWKKIAVRHLDSKGFFVLCLPEAGTTSFEEDTVWPKSVVSICDQIDEIGKGIAESLAETVHLQPDHSSAERGMNRPLIANGLHPLAKKRVSLCDLSHAGPRLANFTVNQVEYISGGSVLNGKDVKLHLVLPKNSPGSLIVSTGVEFPLDTCYVRSYRFKAHTVGTPENPDQLCTDMGMPMVMYMRGFHLSTKNKMLPCLSYYFGSWVLKDKGHFWGAIWYSFLLALLTQGLSAVRAVVVRHVTNNRTKKILLLILYTVQQFMGYLIMLIAMMYSAELLFAVVVGVAVGNRVFVKGDPPTRRPRKNTRREQLREPLLTNERNDSTGEATS